jgi:serine protease inhibitor
MKRITLIGILALSILFCSCDWFKQPDVPIDIEMSEKSALLVDANNQFGFNLFETILEVEAPGENIMISPLSIGQALSMAINGADGNTFAEMLSVLGYDELNLDDLNKTNSSLVSSLKTHDAKVIFDNSNSVWYRNDFAPKTTFLDNNKNFYNAEVNSCDPAQPDNAKNAINKWVDNKTNGKIDKIIDNVSPLDVMFLINAVYFKAKWKTEFKKSDTELKPFTPEVGNMVSVPTMIGKVKLNYYNSEKYSVIKLPYGSGKFNMLIYLPEEGFSTSDISKDISATDFELLRKTELSEYDIWLPKFEYAYSRELNSDLISLGMKDAFDASNANFKNIADLELFISKVMHKTYIKTDEEGSEAAAVTSVTIGLTSIGPGQIIKIDKSFLYAIVEEDTESILFIGRVNNPLTSK